jgi:hypothetical protein
MFLVIMVWQKYKQLEAFLQVLVAEMVVIAQYCLLVWICQ